MFWAVIEIDLFLDNIEQNIICCICCCMFAVCSLIRDGLTLNSTNSDYNIMSDKYLQVGLRW